MSAIPGPYVITFAASLERMPLAVPFLHELDHFSAFRSHSIERGRSVFRLHVGYFESQDAARAALKVVQRHYTDAHIATAPRRDLGSLEDTGITEFAMARPGSAATGRRRADADAAADQSACDVARQRYSIQIDALQRAPGAGGAADLAVFQSYTLYRIYVLLDGVLHQALRLGFFPSLGAAQQILARVKERCPRAIVVPISGREYARIRDLAPRDGANLKAPLADAARASGPALPALDEDDVSCEFGASELPAADRFAPAQPARR